MFDGSTKRRPIVSLRGRSKDEDKFEFLQRAKIERETRARARLETISAICIQKFIRGRLANALAREVQRNDWDRKIADLSQLKADMRSNGAVFSVPTHILMRLITQFLYFYSHSEDIIRFQKLTSILWDEFRIEVAPNIGAFAELVCTQNYQPIIEAMWILRMSKIIVICLFHATLTGTSRYTVALLDLLTDPNQYIATGVNQEVASRVVSCLLDSTYITRQCSIQSRNPLPFLGDTNLLSTLVYGLQNPRHHASQTVCLVFVRAFKSILQALTSLNESSNKSLKYSLAVGHFCEVLFTFPNLINCSLGSFIISHLADQNIWCSILDLISKREDIFLTRMQNSQMASEAIMNLVNLEFSGKFGIRLRDAEPSLQNAYIRLLYKLVSIFPLPLLMKKSVIIDGLGKDSDEDLDESNRSSMIRLETFVHQYEYRASGITDRTDNTEDIKSAKKAIALLTDPSIMSSLFDILLPSAESNFMPSDDPVLELSTLYSSLLLTICDNQISNADAKIGFIPEPGASSRTFLGSLATISQGESIVYQLWIHLLRLGGKKYLLGDHKEIYFAPVIFLFCTLYSHMLTLLDDEEFYVRQYPMPLVQLTDVVAFLKNWLLQLYWFQPIRELSERSDTYRYDADTIRELRYLLAATRLFNQLYEKDSRRSFGGPSLWHWESFENQDLFSPNMDVIGSDDHGEAVVELLGGGPLALVLANIPQVIPFQQRVAIFRKLVDSERTRAAPMAAWGGSDGVRVKVRRDHIFDDSFEALGGLGSSLRKRVQVTFVNEHGVEEAGIDGGGVLKEYMDTLTKCAFSPKLGLFRTTDDQLLYPSSESIVSFDETIARFEFAGTILGKALFEGILVEPQFSPTFLNTLLGRDNAIDDLYTLDSTLYQNLMKLKQLSNDEISNMALTFCVTLPPIEGNLGPNRVVDLIHNGRDIDVTHRTVSTYVHLFAHFRLNRETIRQSRAFLRGFRALIPAPWLRLFGPRELQRLVGGDGEKAVDLVDLRANTVYAGGYHQSQPVIHQFWEVLEGFSANEQAQFLRFVTSCSRQPLLGFRHLMPPFCIQKVPAGERGDKLPTSATCMNLLKLPIYDNIQTLRSKLLYAISAEAGFELT